MIFLPINCHQNVIFAEQAICSVNMATKLRAQLTI